MTDIAGEVKKREIECLVKELDTVELKAALATTKAMLAGYENRIALEIGNAILETSGRKPLPVDVILSQVNKRRTGGQ